jgi:subfamily B ATP-binding cassette protein MsbA
LQGVNLRIRKGETTAIVGKTGAGKTTIGNLLLRLYDCPPDSILIDGTDIRSYTAASLRKRMAFVSQESFLFDDTIRANICFAEENIPEATLVDAAKRARIYDFIQSLPQGFDTKIGEEGILLSGGEKQRISIARAFVKGADIIILDEATNSLDARTEQLVTEAMHEIMDGKTVIVIAHRLATIRKADTIAVMENGTVVEQGTFDGLMQNQGQFYAYWQAQES